MLEICIRVCKLSIYFGSIYGLIEYTTSSKCKVILEQNLTVSPR